MTIEEKILAIWSGNAEAIALVPANRFKVPGNWQGLTRPYVIHRPIVEISSHVHDGGGAVSKLRRWDVYQMSVISDSYSSGKPVAEKMRSLFQGNIDGVQFFYRGQRFVDTHEVVNTEHIAVEFRIDETLTT